MEAVKVDYIVILEMNQFDEITTLTTECVDYDAFMALPSAVEFKGQIFGKSGWNSDRGKAYYNNNTRVARSIR
jgi:hypothetical protein